MSLSAERIARALQPGRERDPIGAGPLVRVAGLTRDYPSGEGVVHALRQVDLTVERGQLLAVRGRSGSGKTTLLNLIGGPDQPTGGAVVFVGDQSSSLPRRDPVPVRRAADSLLFPYIGL